MKQRMVLAILLTLGMAGTAWAMDCPQTVSPTTLYQCTQTVFNDSGAAITSRSVVSWDQDDTDFSSTGYPYILPTSTADDPYTAGVMLTGSCPDQALCTIVVHGLTTVLVADATDNATVDTLVGGSTVSGQAGDYATGANTCALGTLVAIDGTDALDGVLARMWVNVDCD